MNNDSQKKKEKKNFEQWQDLVKMIDAHWTKDMLKIIGCLKKNIYIYIERERERERERENLIVNLILNNIVIKK